MRSKSTASDPSCEACPTHANVDKLRCRPYARTITLARWRRPRLALNQLRKQRLCYFGALLHVHHRLLQRCHLSKDSSSHRTKPSCASSTGPCNTRSAECGYCFTSLGSGRLRMRVHLANNDGASNASDSTPLRASPKLAPLESHNRTQCHT